MNLVEYPDAEMMMMDVADHLAGELRAALSTHDRVTFAVPGGTTPGPLFDLLSAVHLQWDRVTVLPTDERCVPQDHDRSNARLIRARLLTAAAAEAEFLPLYWDGPDAETAVAEIGAELAPRLPLNILLLGMGADMHTASLFPNAPGLAEALDAAAPPLLLLHPDGQPEARVSLTGPVLSGALSTHVVITGAEKRAAVEKASKMPPIEAPVQTVLTNATIHWTP